MSDAIFNLSAIKRDTVGKGASRRLRRENKVPAIVYGGDSEANNITLIAHEVAKAISHEAFFSHILTLSIDNQPEQVIIKDLQRHPVREIIYHMDFLRVSAKETITMQVPLHYIGEEACPGIKASGIVSRDLTEIEVTCLPADLPSFIEVDISELVLDAILHISDIALPKGVTLAHPIEDTEHNLPIVSVHLPRVVAEPEIAPEISPEVPTNADEEKSDEETK